jgi:hypothetical protein
LLRLAAPALALGTSGLAGAAVLPTSAAAAAPTPIALDAPGNGSAPLIAYDPSTRTAYIAWSDPAGTGIDLCLLAAHHGRVSATATIALKTAGGTVSASRTIKITPAKH